MWGEKIEKYPKFVIVWGGNLKLRGGGGGISPPKGPEKKTLFPRPPVFHCLQFAAVCSDNTGEWEG